MPKKSDKQLLIGEIVKCQAIAVLEEDDNDDYGFPSDLLDQRLIDHDTDSYDRMDTWVDSILGETPVEELAELLHLVMSYRYLAPRDYFPLGRYFAENYFNTFSDDDFRQLTRTSRDGFRGILTRIEDHRIFTNSSNYEQAPVWLQLAVAFDRLGTNGNGSSLGRTRLLWGIGKGTAHLHTARVLSAVNVVADEFVAWPDYQERRRISRRMALQGFPGCVGFIDGTTIPLSQKPAVDGQCYFDRKHRYSVNAQVVCDDHRKIIAFYCGWPGSCADSTVYREMPLSKDDEKARYFCRGQYLHADSAYPAHVSRNTIVPAYKKSQHGADKEAFNTCVAHARVVNEHTIGVLKGRFSSLRELRVQIREKEDMKKILFWVSGCVVLHNILLSLNDEWSSEEDSTDTEDEAEEDSEDSDSDSDDDRFPFRKRVKTRVIAKAREQGGILWYRGV